MIFNVYKQKNFILNLPLLNINRNYEMFAHYSFVLPYPLTTMCSYSEQVEDTVQVLETI